MNGNPPPPFNRRRFLSAATLGVTSLGITTWGLTTLGVRPRCLQAAGRKLPPLEFLVVSDTHLGYRDQPQAEQAWARTAVELENAPGDLVLHLGDVVDGGREAQYPRYLKAREALTKPIHEIPGNHDPAELFARYLRHPIDRAVDHGWLRFLLLHNARTDSHDGFVGDEQIAWIDAQCADAAKTDRWVVLCMHVPAHKNLHPDRGWYVKPDHGQTALYATLTRHADRVLALFHGHFHNGIRGWDDHGGLHEICFPSALYNRDRKLEQQQAPGYNLSEFQPGFTRVRIEQGVLRLGYQPTGRMPKDAGPTVEKRCSLDGLPS